jgi:predicted nuclease with TOPRIM domain
VTQVGWQHGPYNGPVTGFEPGEEDVREHDNDLSPIPHDLEVYAHIEGLVGEENELLKEAEQGRKEEHRERLHAIKQELDRAWETLRRRAERHAQSGS